MSYPEIPSLSYSFTAFQEGQGDNSFPGTQLDAALLDLQDAIAAIVAFQALVQRSDGKLAAGSVTKDSLDPSLALGVGSPTNWTTATAYTDGDSVTTGNKLYVAKVNHTSGGVFATDLAAGKWLLLADFSLFIIPDGSIATAKLGDLQVTAAKLALLAVGSAQLADGAATTAKIGDLQVTAAKLALLAVGTAQLANLGVTTGKIADLAVTAAKLAEDIPKAKLEDSGGQRLIGNGTALAAAPTDLTISAVLDWLSSTQGAIAYRGASAWSAITPGTVGQVLRSGGPGADPTFAAIPISKEYLGADTTMVADALTVFPHGFAVEPKIVSIDMVCVTAEAGYSTGDVIQQPVSLGYNDSGVLRTVFTTYKDATNIGVRAPSNPYAANKSTGVAAALTLANWKYRVRAWA